MEHDTSSYTYNGEDTRDFHNQRIINEILKISLEPYLFNELLERILEYLINREHLLLSPKAAIFLIDHDSGVLSLKASVGLDSQQINRCADIEFGQCHCGKAAEKGVIHFFSSPAPLAEAEPSSLEATGHYCVPIVKDDQPIGVLALYVQKSHTLSLEMEQLLESIANILAAVIESQKMDQQLIELVNDLRVSIVSLREEKLFSDSAIQSLKHGLIVADLNGNILKSNRVAQQILMPFEESLDRKNLRTLLGANHADLVAELLSGKATEDEREITLSNEDGDIKIISYSTGPRKDGRGNQVGVIISLSDVTELRHVRREMEKMNRLFTVAEIASAVAHEVRNPLAGIKIMAQSIEEDAVDNSQQLECSRRIIRQVDRLNELLTEFFSYARPVVPNRRPISLLSILTETRPLISSRLQKNNIKLEEVIPARLPAIVADPNQMQQVFLNLILNSIDAIRQDGRIRLSACHIDSSSRRRFKRCYPGVLDDSHTVHVSFADNGAGMPTTVAEKVFEPFFTTKSTGTGLGLSIVYRTLRENNAAITVESSQGNGTTFNMFFQADT